MDISINQVEARIQENFQEFVYNKCVNTLKGTCPKDTGALRASIHAERIDDNTYFVGTDSWYAKFTEYGRGPVFPVVKQALYWPDIKGGRPVKYAREVPAQHWVEAAVDMLT